jgi:arylsulfatase A-like enzyme
MYAHIPSTSNSMLSMVCGIYPKISCQSLVEEIKKDAVPSISGELKNRGWATSLFSSADRTFGDMAELANNTGFMVTDDSRTMNCSYKRLEVTNTLLDGLDDRCIINRYFQWGDSIAERNKFTMFWTNQTHYPYAFDSKREVKYVNNNPEFNRYLNSLKNSDEAFGMLMNGLQERNLLDSTLVIVVGDHGEAFGTHGQTGHRLKIYEENINILCILYNPVLCKGKIENKISSMNDIPTTIANVVGFDKPREWQGKSLFLNTTDDAHSLFVLTLTSYLEREKRIGNTFIMPLPTQMSGMIFCRPIRNEEPCKTE